MTGTALATGFIELGANTQQAGKDIAKLFGDTESKAKESGKKAGAAHGTAFMGVFSKYMPEQFRSTFEGAHKAAEDAGKAAGTKFSGGMKAAMVGVAAGGIAALGVGAVFMEIGKTFEEMNNTIIQKTGASGEALKGLEETAKSVGRNTTQGFEAAGEAVSDLSIKLGISGKPLEELSTQFLNLSRITGTDVKTNIADVSTAFQKWNIQTGDQSAKLDMLYGASTKTGVSVDELASGLQRFGAPLQAMGFGIDQSTALLGGLTKAGVNTDQVMNSLRIGLGKMAKAGQDPVHAFNDLLTSIKAAPTQIAATGIAMQVFGARAGTEMATAVRSGALNVDALTASIVGGGVTINDAAAKTETFGQKWDIFKNKITADLEPAASKLFDAIMKGMNWITDNALPALSKFTGFVKDNKTAFQIAAGVISTVFVPSLLLMVAGWGSAAVAAVTGAASSVAASYSTVAGWVASAAAATASGAETAAIWLMLKTDAISSAAVQIGSNTKVAASWLVGKVQILASTAAVIAHTVVTKALAAATVVWTGIQWALNAALDANPIGLIVIAIAALVGGIILAYKHSETFRDIVHKAWSGIKTAVEAAWNFIKPIWDDFVTALKWIGDKVSWLWDNIIKPVFGFIGNLISDWWAGVQIYFKFFKDGIQILGDIVSWLWDHAIKPAWNAISGAIKTGWEDVIKPAFEAFKTGLGKVGDFFGDVVKGIKTAWNDIKKAVAEPINFVIQTVWNDGLLKAWNMVAGWLPGLKHADPMSPVKFDSGGATRGTRGVDNIPALLGGDEHVFDRYDVDKLGGQAKVYALRHMLDQGQSFSWTPNDGVRAAHTNGIQAFDQGGAPRPAWEFQLNAGHEFAQSRDGHPYTWGFEDCSGYVSMIADKILGGDGNRKWATSSFPGGQPFVEGLGQGFSVGVHDDPGGPGGGHTAGTLSSTAKHAAANVESGGAHGNVMYGKSAAGADSSQWDGVKPGRYHLAIGADGSFEAAGGPSTESQHGFLIDKLRKTLDQFLNPVKAKLPHPPPEYLGWPKGALQGTEDMALNVAGHVIDTLGGGLRSVYEGAKKVGSGVVGAAEGAWNGITSVFRDTGGFIPNGLTLVRNETGQPEAVLNWEQLQAVKDMMHAGKSIAEAVQSVGGDTNPDNFAAANRTLDLQNSKNPQADVEGLAYGAKMQNVIQKSGETFANKVADIIPNALFDIFSPSSSIPNPKDVIDRYTIKSSDSTSGTTVQSDKAGTATGEDSSQVSTQSNTAPTSSSTSTEQQSVTGVAPTDYVGNFVKAAKDHGLTMDAATIAVGAGLVETNMKMYANSTVPESLQFPHDAVGSDHDSMGLLQQRPSWGPVADLMDAYKSSGLFYDKLAGFNWQQMDKGAAAQKVQVSAYPDKYAAQMPYAMSLVKDKFDTGGIVQPGLSIVENKTGGNEHMGILTTQQWDSLATLSNGGGNGSVDNRMVFEKGSIVTADLDGFRRTMKHVQIKNSMGYRGRPSQ